MLLHKSVLVWLLTRIAEVSITVDCGWKSTRRIWWRIVSPYSVDKIRNFLSLGIKLIFMKFNTNINFLCWHLVLLSWCHHVWTVVTDVPIYSKTHTAKHTSVNVSIISPLSIIALGKTGFKYFVWVNKWNCAVKSLACKDVSIKSQLNWCGSLMIRWTLCDTCAASKGIAKVKQAIGQH